MKARGEREFNKTEKELGGKPSIPLELKILCALRSSASGLKFKDAAEMSGYMSETAANKFFKECNRLFRPYVNRFEGEDTELPPSVPGMVTGYRGRQNSMKLYSMLGLPRYKCSVNRPYASWQP